MYYLNYYKILPKLIEKALAVFSEHNWIDSSTESISVTSEVIFTKSPLPAISSHLVHFTSHILTTLYDMENNISLLMFLSSLTYSSVHPLSHVYGSRKLKQLQKTTPFFRFQLTFLFLLPSLTFTILPSPHTYPFLTLQTEATIFCLHLASVLCKTLAQMWQNNGTFSLHANILFWGTFYFDVFSWYIKRIKRRIFNDWWLCFCQSINIHFFVEKLGKDSWALSNKINLYIILSKYHFRYCYSPTIRYVISRPFTITFRSPIGLLTKIFYKSIHRFDEKNKLLLQGSIMFSTVFSGNIFFHSSICHDEVNEAMSSPFFKCCCWMKCRMWGGRE